MADNDKPVAINGVYQKTIGKSGDGAGGALAQFQNYRNDYSRNVGNWLGTVGNWFASGKDIPAGAGYGDSLVGSDPNYVAPGESPSGTRRTPTLQSQGRGVTRPRPAADEGPKPPTLLEQMLSEINANFQGGDGGYGGLIANLQGNAPADRARIEALYKQYASAIASQEAGIQGNYAQSADSYGNIYDKASSNVSGGYDAARNAQTEQLKALGLTSYAPTDSSLQQAGASSKISDLRAAVLAQNEATRNAAISNNQAQVGAASREGVGAVSEFDRNLSNMLAQLQAKQQAAQVDSNNQLAKLRQGAYDTSSRADTAQAKMEMDAQIAAANQAGKVRAPVDYQGILASIIQNNPNLSYDQAKVQADSVAKYS